MKTLEKKFFDRQLTIIQNLLEHVLDCGEGIVTDKAVAELQSAIEHVAAAAKEIRFGGKAV